MGNFTTKDAINQYYQRHPKSILKNNLSDDQEVSGLVNRSKASKSSLKSKSSPRTLKVSFMDQLSLDPKKNLKIFTFYPEEESNFPPPPNENRLVPIDEEELRNLGIVFRKLEIEEEFSRKGSGNKKAVLYSQSIMEKLQRDLEKDRQAIEQQETTQKQNAMLRKQEKKEKKKEKKELEEKKQEEERKQEQANEKNPFKRYQSQQSGQFGWFGDQNDYYTRQLLDDQLLKEIEKIQQDQILEEEEKRAQLNEQKRQEQIKLQELKQQEQEQQLQQQQQQKKISIPKINLESVKKQVEPNHIHVEPSNATNQNSNNLQKLNNNIFKALQQLPPGIMKPPIPPTVNNNQPHQQEDQSDALESSHSFNELFSSRENTYRMQKK